MLQSLTARDAIRTQRIAILTDISIRNGGRVEAFIAAVRKATRAHRGEITSLEPQAFSRSLEPFLEEIVYNSPRAARLALLAELPELLDATVDVESVVSGPLGGGEAHVTIEDTLNAVLWVLACEVALAEAANLDSVELALEAAAFVADHEAERKRRAAAPPRLA